LVVAAGAQFAPSGKLLKTGLEGLLTEFNVQLFDRALYGEPTRELDPALAVVQFAPPAIQARNPIALALGEKAGFITPNWRPVFVANPQPDSPFRVVPLLMTRPGRYSWFEEEKPFDPNQVWEEIRVRPAKGRRSNPVSVGVVVSESASGRAAVFGNGLIFSDAVVHPGQCDPPSFDLLSATVDWLRDRPTLGIGVEAKKYKEFAFPIASDETRGLWLPLALTMLVVAGAGAGVWVVRRK
jgi:hypothetical protein